jgi:hypothetical protein
MIMSLLGSLLQQVEGSDALASLAAKVGLPADQVQSIGDSLLAKIQGGSTAEQAAADTAAETGADPDQVQAMIPAIADHVGADGASGIMDKLGGMAGASGIMGTVTGMLDRDGDGNPLNDVMGMAKGLFGSKT